MNARALRTPGPAALGRFDVGVVVAVAVAVEVVAAPSLAAAVPGERRED